MKQIVFFLLVLSLALVSSIFAQPIFVVSHVDCKYEAVNDFIFEGELENCEDNEIYIKDNEEYDYNPLHILYKDQIISIFPEYRLNVNDFYNGEEDFYLPDCRPYNQSYAIEKPPYDFDKISEGLVQSTDQRTGRCRVGKIIKGDITIEYQNKTKTMVIYFSDVRVAWKKKKH